MIGNAARALSETQEFVERLEATNADAAVDPDQAPRLEEARALLRAIVAEGGTLMLDAADLLRRSLVVDLAIVQRGRARPKPHEPRTPRASPTPSLRLHSTSPADSDAVSAPGHDEDSPAWAERSSEVVDASRLIYASSSAVAELEGPAPGRAVDEAAPARLREMHRGLLRTLREPGIDARHALEAADVARRVLALELGHVAHARPANESRKAVGPNAREDAMDRPAPVRRVPRHEATGLPQLEPARPAALGVSLSPVLRPVVPPAPPEAYVATQPRTLDAPQEKVVEHALGAAEPAPPPAGWVAGGLVAARAVGVVLVAFVFYALYGTGYTEGLAQRRMNQATHLRVSSPNIGLDQLVAGSDSLSALAKGPSLLPGSGAPGSAAPIVILGHRTTDGGPFRHLSALKPGSIVDLHASGGPNYRYIVERIVTLAPGAGLNEPRGGQALFLVSATPAYHDARRLVVVARLVGPGVLPTPPQKLEVPRLTGSSVDFAAALVVIVLLGAGWAARWRYRSSIPRWAARAAWVPAVIVAYISWQLLLGSMSRLL